MNISPVLNKIAPNKDFNIGINNNLVYFSSRVNSDKFEKSNPYLVKGNPENFSREKTVAVYCSSSKNGYDNAYDLGQRIAKSPKLGGVLTGGTVGLMEAVNKGCFDAGGYSIGVSEKTLEAKQPPNNYLNEHHSTPNDNTREDWYNKRAAYTVILAGGPGTLRETFNKLVFLLKDKFFKQKDLNSDRFQHQLILVEDENSKGMWKKFFKWIKDYPMQMGYFSPEYLAHVKVVDSNEKAIRELEKGIDYDPLKDSARLKALKIKPKDK